MACEPRAIADDVFCAVRQVILDAVFVIAAIADFVEDTLGCLVVSLGFENSGDV